MAKRVIDVVIPSAMWGPRILGGMMNLSLCNFSLLPASLVVSVGNKCSVCGLL